MAQIHSLHICTPGEKVVHDSKNKAKKQDKDPGAPGLGPLELRGAIIEQSTSKAAQDKPEIGGLSHRERIGHKQRKLYSRVQAVNRSIALDIDKVDEHNRASSSIDVLLRTC
jgi:hypothetical protein